MQVANIMKMSIAVMIAALLMVGIVAPMIDAASRETTTITNEGAGDLRYTYAAEPVDYSSTIVYNDVSDEITAGFGTADLQTIAAVKSIIWASNVGAIVFNGATFYLMIDDGEHVVNVDLGDRCDINVAEGVVSIADANDTVYSGAISWSYAPQKNGQFGFFTDSGATVKDFPVAAAGLFAGVYAYNENNSLNLATMAPTYSVTDEVFNTGPWTVPDLGAKTVKPIVEEKEVKEIEEIKEIEEKTIKAVPTPTYTDGDWGFNLNGTNAIIVSYSGAAGNLSIPATVSNGGTSYPVTQIGYGSPNSPIFNNATIAGSTITIPDSVTIIAQYAFWGCSGFTGTLTIPDSVHFISSYAFRGCSGFTGLTIPDSVRYLEQYAFEGCSGFTGTLTIPNSLTSIDKYVFQNCSGFTGLTIPDSVTTINVAAFKNCSGFTGTLTIPDSVETIVSAAFQGCSGFTGLTISNSVTSITASAFEGCSGFTGPLVIPDSVKTIAASAFKGCSGFTGPLVIPESVDMVESAAFNGCTGFSGIVIMGSPSFGSYPFTGMTVDVLNLGTASISPGQYGLAADAVIDDEIPSLGYMAPATFSETVQKTGTLYTVMGMLPVLMLAGVLVMTAAAFINNRRA